MSFSRVVILLSMAVLAFAACILSTDARALAAVSKVSFNSFAFSFSRVRFPHISFHLAAKALLAPFLAKGGMRGRRIVRARGREDAREKEGNPVNEHASSGDSAKKKDAPFCVSSPPGARVRASERTTTSFTARGGVWGRRKLRVARARGARSLALRFRDDGKTSSDLLP